MAKLPVPLAFDWDQGNIEKNWIKHKVSQKEAEEVFFNEKAIFEDPEHSTYEQRFVIYGRTNLGRKLSIIFTVRNRKISRAFLRIRVISARDQNKKERRVYEKAKKNTKI